MRQPHEAVRPRQRTAVGVGDVDLDLRHGNEDGGQRQRQHRVVDHTLVGMDEHIDRLGRLRRAAAHAQRQHRQQAAGADLERPDDDPAGSRHHQSSPPSPAVCQCAVGQETQVIGLFANLTHQREEHTRCGAEQKHVEAAAGPGTAIERRPRLQERGVLDKDETERCHQEHDPDRLRPGL